MSSTTPSTLTKHPKLSAMLNDLLKQKAALQEQLKPHRELYDKHVNDSRYIAARKAIKEINTKLGPIESEISALSIALGGRSLKVEPGTFTKV